MNKNYDQYDSINLVGKLEFVDSKSLKADKCLIRIHSVCILGYMRRKPLYSHGKIQGIPCLLPILMHYNLPDHLTGSEADMLLELEYFCEV